MFNLNVFDTVSAANAGSELHLLHTVHKTPVYLDEKETKPLIITLLGSDSDVYTKEIEKKAKELRRQKNNASEIDLKKNVREACELYSKLTVGFKNIPDDNNKGKCLEFSQKAAFELYMKHKDIRVQVGDFIADQANFIKD